MRRNLDVDLRIAVLSSCAWSFLREHLRAIPRAPHPYVKIVAAGATKQMLVFWELRKTTQKLKTWQGKNECKDCEPAPIQDWSVDSRVRAFLASDQVCADKA